MSEPVSSSFITNTAILVYLQSNSVYTAHFLCNVLTRTTYKKYQIHSNTGPVIMPLMNICKLDVPFAAYCEF